FTNRKKDGALFEVDSTISPLRDAAGDVTHYIALGKEVTEQYRLEQQLRQAQRMEIVGNMAGAIAHDFNNLLLPITGYTQLLQETIPADSQQGKDLAMVLSGATRAKELINQILLFSTQQEGRREAIHLEPVVEEVLGFLRPTLAASITIREKFPSEPAVVLADHTLVHQILTNLCLNAAQAMPDGGELRVELDHVQVREQKDHLGNLFSGDFVRIGVADQGIGMDEATRLNIFAPFFTTKGQGKGTGLGLATVLRIVQISEGHISVETAPGKGARFDVYLRRSDGESAEKTPAPPEIIGGNETILFVDDEEVIVTLAKRTLEGMGYQVTGVTESGQAISLFEAEPKKFDLVVTDLKMPNLGGEELAKAVKRTREDVPILLCTGFMESITPQWARKVGFCGVLLKPFRVEELGNRVRLAIDGAATGGQETAATK
ncbi:MAG: ATP-binding protein, partial [bacterium]